MSYSAAIPGVCRMLNVCPCYAIYDHDQGSDSESMLLYRYVCSEHGGPKEEDNGCMEALDRKAQRLGLAG